MTSQQAITLLRNLEQSLDDYCELNDEGKTAFRMAIAALGLFGNAEQLPSAQRWIPCSERLPDMHDEVLVTARGEVSIAWLYVDGKWRSNDMPQPMFKDIIAWMPLPEPYKGEQDENR